MAARKATKKTAKKAAAKKPATKPARKAPPRKAKPAPKAAVRVARAASAARYLVPRAEFERIVERVLKFSRADETEVVVDATTDALTRFANNTIHQNVAEQGIAVSVRAVVDGRTARASTNKTDDESLARVARAAADLALLQPPSKTCCPCPAVRNTSRSGDSFPQPAPRRPRTARGR